VGAVAYAPSNPDIVYVGTGEGGWGVDFIPGIGLLRSDDGGDTWELPDSVVATQFFRINVDPRDPETLLAATNQGLLRSTTGGATWTTPIPATAGGTSRKLMVSDVVRSAQNPDELWAALWCFAACPAGFGRVMRSTDNGVTWEAADGGLPEASDDSSLNRIALAIVPSRDGNLYVVCEKKPTSGKTPDVELYRTNDGGATWNRYSSPGQYLGQQGWYDNTLTVHPTIPSRLVGGGVYYVLSSTAGSSWTSKNPYKGGQNLPHVDAHDLQWQGNTLWVACDGGVWKSDDFGETWTDCNRGLITRQFYSLAIDPVHRERVLAGAQDNGTNRRRDTGDDAWDQVIGGDGFECAINPMIPDIEYGTVYNTQILRALDSHAFEDVSPSYGSDESAPFITPLSLRANRPATMYTGTTRVWKSTNGGDTWSPLPETVINGTWSKDTVWAIASTPADPNVLMVAKNRNLYRTEDGGATWRVTRFGENGLPDRRVLNVEISPFDPRIALACLAVLNGDSLYRTTDGGLTWEPSDTGLRPFAVQVARWDPTDPATVYAGTDVGLYRSTDGGVTWQPFGTGLPAVSVQEIRVLPDGSMMRVATHGRGVWGLKLPDSGNHAPEVAITSPAGDAELTVGDTVTFTATASDPDGDPVAATWLATDDWKQVDGGQGQASLSSSFTHTFELAGTHMVAINVRDAHATPAVATLTVTVRDPADSCATPRVLPGDGPFPLVTTLGNDGATIEDSDPSPACVDSKQDADAGRAASMWVDFTPAESGEYTISTCGSGADTVLSVWTGDACGTYVPVDNACNDDDGLVHCSSERASSYLDLALDAGTTYHIMIGSFTSGRRGPVRLTIDVPSSGGAQPGHAIMVPPAASRDSRPVRRPPVRRGGAGSRTPSRR